MVFLKDQFKGRDCLKYMGDISASHKSSLTVPYAGDIMFHTSLKCLEILENDLLKIFIVNLMVSDLYTLSFPR